MASDSHRRYVPGLALMVVVCLGAFFTTTVLYLMRPLWYQILGEVLTNFEPESRGLNFTGLEAGLTDSANSAAAWLGLRGEASKAAALGVSPALAALLASPVAPVATSVAPADSPAGAVASPVALAASPEVAPVASPDGPAPFVNPFEPASFAAEQLAALSPKELEKLRADARQRSWEEQWFLDYLKFEERKRQKVAADLAVQQAANLAEFNLTLSKEVAHKIASPEGYLFVTFANHHYTQFALTWVAHLRAVNLTNFIIGALDEEILTTLAKQRINTCTIASGLTKGDFGWGSKVFATAQRRKITMIGRMLQYGVQVIVSDIDAMWVRNPLPFFERFPEADILTSSDTLAPTVGKEEKLEFYPHAGSAFNTGIFLLRNASIALVQEWIDLIEGDINIWDQNAFNELTRRGQHGAPDHPQNLFKGDNGKLTIGILPVAYFCSGHVYFTQDLPERLGITPYVVHATFQFSGTDGKRHRFRERLLWGDTADYFKSPGGFLIYEPEIPDAIFNASGPRTNKAEMANIIGHFDLVNNQLRQLRTALALAATLNRTLILPQIWCGLDRWWAPHGSVIPGSAKEFTLPFVCPADHVLDLENGMAKTWYEREYGPHIGFREWSFLDNPRLPDSVAGSKVSVSICKEGDPGCSNGSSPATLEQNKVAIAANMDSERIKMALSGVQHVQVLNFTTMHGAFGNFTAEADWAKFAKRVAQYGAVWCCIDTHPGHIHYDMLWDLPGHMDRHGRIWGQWEPKTGP